MLFFSVIITTHNAQQTIRKTLNSVLSQTFKSFEIVVVDDKSLDYTLTIIDQMLRESNFESKVIKLNENKGVSEARNCGVNVCRGKYVAFLDDDDIWLPNKLKMQYEDICCKGVDWLFSNYYVVNDQYKKISKRYRNPGKYDFKKIIVAGNPVGFLTVVVKKEILISHPFKKVHHEDYDLWLRLSKNGYKGYLDEKYLALYMKRKNSISSNKLKSMTWTFNLLKSYSVGWQELILLMIKYFFNALIRFKRL